MPGSLPTVPELPSPDFGPGSPRRQLQHREENQYDEKEYQKTLAEGRLSPAISDIPSPLLGRASPVSMSFTNRDGRVSRALSDVSPALGEDGRRFEMELPSPVERGGDEEEMRGEGLGLNGLHGLNGLNGLNGDLREVGRQVERDGERGKMVGNGEVRQSRVMTELLKTVEGFHEESGREYQDEVEGDGEGVGKSN